MLVLSRQRNESIMINDDICVTVVDIRGDKVRLGVDAPQEVPVHRKEIYDEIQKDPTAKNYKLLGAKKGTKVFVNYTTAGQNNIEERVYFGRIDEKLEFISLISENSSLKILSERVLDKDMRVEKDRPIKYGRCEIGIYSSTLNEIQDGNAHPDFLERWELLKRNGYVR